MLNVIFDNEKNKEFMGYVFLKKFIVGIYKLYVSLEI